MILRRPTPIQPRHTLRQVALMIDLDINDAFHPRAPKARLIVVADRNTLFAVAIVFHCQHLREYILKTVPCCHPKAGIEMAESVLLKRRCCGVLLGEGPAEVLTGNDEWMLEPTEFMMKFSEAGCEDRIGAIDED